MILFRYSSCVCFLSLYIEYIQLTPRVFITFKSHSHLFHLPSCSLCFLYMSSSPLSSERTIVVSKRTFFFSQTAQFCLCSQQNTRNVSINHKNSKAKYKYDKCFVILIQYMGFGVQFVLFWCCMHMNSRPS